MDIMQAAKRATEVPVVEILKISASAGRSGNCSACTRDGVQALSFGRC